MSCSAFNILETLHMSVVIYDANCEAVLLTSRAARLLRIEHRDQLHKYSELLEPLTKLAKLALKQQQPLTSNNSVSYKEVSITTADGRQYQALIDAFLIDNLSIDIDLKGPQGVAIRIMEISAIGSIVNMLNNICRIRPYVFSLSTNLSVSLNQLIMGKTNAQLVTAKTKDPNDYKEGNSDLLICLSEAIDILDPLISSGVKISTNTPYSALIAVPSMPLIEILGQSILEAADFASPNGKISISAQFPQQKDKQDKSPNSPLEQSTITIIITSNKVSTLTKELTLIEKYIFKKVFPLKYKATVNKLHQQETTQQLETNLSEESLSDCIKLATELIKNNNIRMEVKHSQSDLLEIYLHLPLLKAVEKTQLSKTHHT